MKKIKKVIILVAAFAMPTIASPATCNCYSVFNAGWQAANTSFATCSSNAMMANMGSYFGGGFGTSIGALNGFLKCQSTFYGIWDQLGAQFNYCIGGCQ